GPGGVRPLAYPAGRRRRDAADLQSRLADRPAPPATRHARRAARRGRRPGGGADRRGQLAVAALPVHSTGGDRYASQRSWRKNWRTSATSKSGSSMAAKWPPRSNSLQCTMLFDISAKRLIGGAIS